MEENAVHSFVCCVWELVCGCVQQTYSVVCILFLAWVSNGCFLQSDFQSCVSLPENMFTVEDSMTTCWLVMNTFCLYCVDNYLYFCWKGVVKCWCLQIIYKQLRNGLMDLYHRHIFIQHLNLYYCYRNILGVFFPHLCSCGYIITVACSVCIIWFTHLVYLHPSSV